MFDTVEEVKQFIEWAQEKGLEQVSVGEVHITFGKGVKLTDVPSWNPKDLEVTEQEDEYDEKTLFHSSEG